MYSVKPGRGPSLMGAAGGIIVAIIGVGWTIMAGSIGAPVFFQLFGVLFVVMAIAGVVYNFYNATQGNRMSAFDVTTDHEESDPIADAMGVATHAPEQGYDPGGGAAKFGGEFCPFCGTKVSHEFRYCPKCGKELAG